MKVVVAVGAAASQDAVSAGPDESLAGSAAVAVVVAGSIHRVGW